MNKRLDEVQYARAFAMFAVLFVHFSSTGLGAVTPESSTFYVYSAFNTLGKLGVPVFFFLSGLVLFYSYNNRPFTKETIRQFYKKRLKYIIVPYLVISTFYFVVRIVHSSSFSSVPALLTGLGEALLWGEAYTHLYFLFVLLQFYLAFPLILYFFKKVKVRVLTVLLASLALQFAWFYVNKNYLQVEARGSYFLSYVSFFLVGAAVGSNYAQLDHWWQVHRKKMAVFIVTLFVLATTSLIVVDSWTRADTLVPYLPSSPYHTYIFDGLWVLLGLAGSLFTLWLGKMVIVLDYAPLQIFLNRLAQLSFGIYLIHPFFLLFFRSWLPSSTPLVFHGWQLFTAIAITAICWVLTSWLSKWKMSWIIIGK